MHAFYIYGLFECIIVIADRLQHPQHVYQDET